MHLTKCFERKMSDVVQPSSRDDRTLSGQPRTIGGGIQLGEDSLADKAEKLKNCLQFNVKIKCTIV